MPPDPRWPRGMPKSLLTLIEELAERLPEIAGDCDLIRRLGNRTLHASPVMRDARDSAKVIDVNFRLRRDAQDCILALRRVLERLFT